MLAAAVAAAAASFPDTTVPGAGYRAGGWAKCGGCSGDGPSSVSVDLLARVCEYSIPNTAAGNGAPATFVLRTWVNGTTGECGSSPLGPTVTVRPGDVVSVLVRNNISQDGWFADGPLGPAEVTPADYLPYVGSRGRYAGMQNCSAAPLRFYGSPPPCGPGSNESAGTCTPNGLPDSGFTVNWENMPRDFDNTNLHLHGMQVSPHLFHPQGTSDPEADYITILPPSHANHTSQGCYCYRFKIPDDHPTGTFWYHVHRHNAVAVQAWSGMAGMLRVFDAERGQDAELARYGVAGEVPFVIWDPHVRAREDGAGGTMRHAVRGLVKEVDSFLMDQTDQSAVVFLVNAARNPVIRMRPGSVWRLRVLCATTENLASFRVYGPGAGAAQPFYHVASDGVAFDRAYRKDVLVLAGGQREDVLIQLPVVGTYTVRMEGLEFVQFFCTGPDNATLATIVVAGDPAPPTQPIDTWTFTPGMGAGNSIDGSDIGARRTVTLNVFANRGVAPFPQFSINGNSYSVRRVDEWVKVGAAEEWLLINPDNTWHPFHMHVNPFVVVDVRSSWPYVRNFTDVAGRTHGPYGLDVHAYATEQVPARRWRDTTFLPPFSVVRIWTRFMRGPKSVPNGFVGKSVFHCHFLAHEDTGMIANFMILPAASECEPFNKYNQTWEQGNFSCYGYPQSSR